MLDLRFIRAHPEIVKEGLLKRREDVDIDKLLELDENRRKLLSEVEQLKSRQNIVSKEIPKMKKKGKDVKPVLEEMKFLSEDIKRIDGSVQELTERIQVIMYSIPNIPHPTVPVGDTEEENKPVRYWGEPREFEFNAKAHWDIGTELGILDFATAGKITGARFALYRGAGAALERALINFFLDVHISEHGYEEIFPPFMVHRRSMIGTGQLPKFEEDAFKIENADYFLIPTAEVPVTNIYREQIIEPGLLPIKHVAYSACFRAEAGSAGRDTRGLIRQHQFNKVELVKFVEPETSYDELETLVEDAEKMLRLLNIPYRVNKMCTADLGFTAAKKYDLELWMPSYDRYVEVSSCSNFEDFQARRADIKYRPAIGEKARYVHTLNGSGLAVGRTLAAILENFQQEDGSVTIPEPLHKYMNGLKRIERNGV